MLEFYEHTTTCPNCKSPFYPYEAFTSEYLCGDQLCFPSPRQDKVMDCKIYYFCSEECYEEFQVQAESCPYITRWHSLLENISEANKQFGSVRLKTYRLNKKL